MRWPCLLDSSARTKVAPARLFQTPASITGVYGKNFNEFRASESKDSGFTGIKQRIYRKKPDK
jgi:hypothetical protein